MSTTQHFQIYPDYYNNRGECKSWKKKGFTNPRYKNFNQTHFTAGDREQFEAYKYSKNNSTPVLANNIELKNNLYFNSQLTSSINWPKYNNINGNSVYNTFEYMFNKFKKGIFIKIVNNELKVFLPFSKKNFINEWSMYIDIDPKFGNMYNFVKYINNLQGKKYPIRINDVEKWYSNNCLIRFESPTYEGDTNVPIMSDMLKTLCKNRKLPDIEFFINRRDFPVLKKNGTEAYDEIYGNDIPLKSHNYSKYCPIFSMVNTDEFADIPIPTGDDWARASQPDSKFFPKNCREYIDESKFNTNWEDKLPTAVFRGSSTGCGVTVDTNPRLKLAYLNISGENKVNPPYLDTGITKWQLRPRKLKSSKYLQTINITNLAKQGITLASFMTPLDQSRYKYIVHPDGHVSAFRLSYELSMGSVLLIVDSKYKLWFRHLLKPWVHYVPIKEDLSDIFEIIKWCRNNDNKCKEIANNAKIFYRKYLQKDGILDYLQNLIVKISNITGTYKYNDISPLDLQISGESTFLETINKNTIKDLNFILPNQTRTYGMLKGIETLISGIGYNILNLRKSNKPIFTSKLSNIHMLYLTKNYPILIKSTGNIQKTKENIHEAYIGIKGINNLINYIPNFSYIFGFVNLPKQVGNGNAVITEFIKGITFFNWIKSAQFNIRDYINILLQLALALAFAQEQIGFVHYDLFPWNIMIQVLTYPITFDYPIQGKIHRISTRIIPVIIDYGKSHTILNNKHYGFIQMYKTSTVQDIYSILISTLTIIAERNSNQSDLLYLFNFLSKSRLFPKSPTNIYELRKILSIHKSYENIVDNPKYDLEKLTPLDFINYLQKPYTFLNIREVHNSVFRLSDGNPKQVLYFLQSKNNLDRINSFLNVFKDIQKCDLPKHSNLLFNYIAAQTIEQHIIYIKNAFDLFLRTNNIDPKPYSKIYKNVYDMILNHFKPLIEVEPINVDYKITDNPIRNIEAYTQRTFLQPDEMNRLYNKYSEIKNTENNHIKYKLLITQVLTYSIGKFKMTDEHKQFYINNFKNLFETDSISILNNNANVNTFLSIYNNPNFGY